MRINSQDNFKGCLGTRWACRYLALDVVASTFDSILATLEVNDNGNDKPKAVEAVGILVQVLSFLLV